YRCKRNQKCLIDGDCFSGVCDSGVCAPNDICTGCDAPSYHYVGQSREDAILFGSCVRGKTGKLARDARSCLGCCGQGGFLVVLGCWGGFNVPENQSLPSSGWCGYGGSFCQSYDASCQQSEACYKGQLTADNWMCPRLGSLGGCNSTDLGGGSC